MPRPMPPPPPVTTATFPSSETASRVSILVPPLEDARSVPRGAAGRPASGLGSDLGLARVERESEARDRARSVSGQQHERVGTRRAELEARLGARRERGAGLVVGDDCDDVLGPGEPDARRERKAPSQ